VTREILVRLVPKVQKETGVTLVRKVIRETLVKLDLLDHKV